MKFKWNETKVTTKLIKKTKIIITVILLNCSMGLTLSGCTKKETNKVAEATVSSSTNAVQLEKTTIYVFIAASLNNAMTKVQEMYHTVQPNVTIVYNPDSSGTLKTQIEQGAECDIFFSAAMKQMNDLNAAGYIENNSIVKLLENQVVLIKSNGATTLVKGFDTITSAKNIALAGEDVPVGAYAREIFRNLGIYDKVMTMEINQGANVTAVLAAVSEGSNEIGIVYATDAASVANKVDIIASAPSGSLSSPVVYPVGQVKNPDADVSQNAAVTNFLSYLQSDEVAKIFEEYGFSKTN